MQSFLYALHTLAQGRYTYTFFYTYKNYTSFIAHKTGTLRPCAARALRALLCVTCYLKLQRI